VKSPKDQYKKSSSKKKKADKHKRVEDLRAFRKTKATGGCSMLMVKS